jgi:hypothetical protein
MERLLAVERMNADGISIFGYRNNDSDFKKAINRRQTPERGNTDWPSFDRTCGCCRKNQCQGGIGFWGTEIAIFTSRKPLTVGRRNSSFASHWYKDCFNAREPLISPQTKIRSSEILNIISPASHWDRHVYNIPKSLTPPRAKA